MSFNLIVLIAFLFSSGLVVCMIIYAKRTGTVLTWSLFAMVFLLISIILFPRVLGYELVSAQEDWLYIIVLVPILWIIATLSLVRTNDMRILKKEHDRSLFHLDILTHDIANMSTPAISYIELLSNSESIGEKEKAILGKVQSHLERMRTLVTRIRFLTSGELDELNKEVVVDTKSTIEESTVLFRIMSTMKVDIEINDSEKGEKVVTGGLIDEIILSVFLEVMEGAKPEDSKIFISESRKIKGDSDFVEIDIINSGQRSEDSMREGMFGFKRSMTLRRYSKGIGLSIPECDRLLRMHGGHLEVDKQPMSIGFHSKHFKISLLHAEQMKS